MLGLLRCNYNSERKPQLTEETEFVPAELEIVDTLELPGDELAQDDEAVVELLCTVLEDKMIVVPL